MLVTQEEIAMRMDRHIGTIRHRAMQHEFPRPKKVGGPRNLTKFYDWSAVKRYWEKKGDGRGRWPRKRRGGKR